MFFARILVILPVLFSVSQSVSNYCYVCDDPNKWCDSNEPPKVYACAGTCVSEKFVEDNGDFRNIEKK